MRTRRLIAVCCLIPAIIGTRPAAAQQEAADYVALEAGNLPIILAAPHGGREQMPGVPERQGEGVRQFSALTDAGTLRLTEALANAIEERLGKRPYTIIAQAHRKYVDPNRRERDAHESPAAKAAYDAYHRALAEARSDVINRWGRGLLLDIHGQSSEPDAIFRGTRDGQTTTHLIDRFGREALVGKTSLFGRLAGEGFPVIPAVDSKDAEDRRYNGGYTVATYGSGAGGTLDAIQLELGRNLRRREALPSTANRLARAIAAFSKEYLPQQGLLVETANGKPQADRVRIGIYCDAGASSNPQKLIDLLNLPGNATVRKLKGEDIRSGALDQLDVLIHPGGSGSKQAESLGDDGRQLVRRFIADGGGFVGICAGAYLASADYTWSLHVLDAKVLDRKHWARGTGMVRIALTDSCQTILDEEDATVDVYYGQGPLLAPGGKDDIVDYEVLATYETEIAKNGAPQGVMPGTTAIARAPYGRGRVFCFSPHPEKTDGLESMIHHAIEDVRPERSHQKSDREAIVPR